MKFSDDNPILSAAEIIGGAAKEALRQRDEARRERDAACKRAAAFEAQVEDLRGRANGVDVGTLRDAIRALLKSETTSGGLRRALGDLVR